MTKRQLRICHICGEQWKFGKAAEHFATKHNIQFHYENRNYVCSLCGARYPSVKVLVTNHIVKMHSPESVIQPIEYSIIEELEKRGENVAQVVAEGMFQLISDLKTKLRQMQAIMEENAMMRKREHSLLAEIEGYKMAGQKELLGKAKDALCEHSED